MTKTSAAIKSRVQRELEKELQEAGIDLIELSLVQRAAFAEIFAHGLELSRVVECKPAPEFIQKLQDFFQTQNLRLIQVQT
ncbi:MAG: hypothetical protein OXH65_11975 [Paracoccaceae bacterium]|nr:hypothetical protein [Paracoccaceae bacterium]MDE2675813.1 hypothetical protein [Paracoccaceae bacterium]